MKDILLWNVDEPSLQKLDAYKDEGNLYHRRKVPVHVQNRQITAFVYLGNPARLGR